MASRKIKDLLPIKHRHLGVLIVVNLETGEYEVQCEGPTVSGEFFNAVIESVKKMVLESVNEDGMLGPKEEEKEDKPADTEDNIPPWLKSN